MGGAKARDILVSGFYCGFSLDAYMFVLFHHDWCYIISCTLLACVIETFDISVQ